VAAPLPGFNAATASPAERAATGLDALPAAFRRLAEAPGMRYDAAGSLCQGGPAAAPFNRTSPNWAGVVLYRPGDRAAYWQSAASWTIPHFTASCGPDSDHSMWTGVGGFAKSPGRLMQAGVDTVIGDGASDPDAVYPFWEVLSYQNFPDNIELPVRVPLAMHGGDQVTIVTEYLASQGKVIFWFLDRTTGRYKLYTLTSLYGHPPSFFFDGSSAEVVNENASSAYREPAGNVTRVSQVDFNYGLPASAFPADERLVTMTSNGNRNGRVLDAPSGLRTVNGPSVLRSSQWSDLWHGCS
jgi:Peptidase A4 family